MFVAPVRPTDAARRAQVLLAEDDVQLRRLVGETLRSRGLIVLEVASGTGLLQTLGSCLLGELHAPDLVLSDQRMPGTTGLEVLEGLRRAGWELPFVLLTAFGDPTLQARAVDLGAEVVDKPCDLDALAALVEERCARGTRRAAPPGRPDAFQRLFDSGDDEEA